MEIFSLDQHCCSTCEHWEGVRVLGECQHIYAMWEELGCCRMRRKKTAISDSCTDWGALRMTSSEFDMTWNANTNAAQKRHSALQHGFSESRGHLANGFMSQRSLRYTPKCRKIGEIAISALRKWWFSSIGQLTKDRQSWNRNMSNLSHLLLLIILALVLASYNRAHAAGATNLAHAMGTLAAMASSTSPDQSGKGAWPYASKRDTL